MTLQEALCESAQKNGYKNWEEVLSFPNFGSSSVSAIAIQAAELYAASKAKEAYNQGVKDAAENAKIEGTDWCGVNKQLILKLLKP